MHQAPALTLTLQPDPCWPGAVRGCGGLALLSTLGWMGWHVAESGRPEAALLAIGAAATSAALALLRTGVPTPDGTLSWLPEPGLWRIESSVAARLGHITCMVSTQDWLLLRHAGIGIDATWLPLSRRVHAEQWHALRCAVFSPGASPVATTMPGEAHG